jgi:regulator of sirC expression with transglutaminase-like and TPR domain
MVPYTEVPALLRLIDDPDTEVFLHVRDRILTLGKEMVPHLEAMWERTPEVPVQERLEFLIHKLHFGELQHDFGRWASEPDPDLMEGAFLVSRYKFPDIDMADYRSALEKICKSIWLELNNYLTPLEQINIVNKVLYSHHMFKGVEISYSNQEDFLVHKLLDTRRGNSIANGILYQTVCQMLDIPVRAIHLPRQFILACFETNKERGSRAIPTGRILFYIDPLSGQVYSQRDVEQYFKRISVKAEPAHYLAMHPQRIIAFLIEEFAKCFDDEKSRHKHEELLGLGGILLEGLSRP